MENYEDYVAILVDNGEGYSFANGTTCQYGEILKAIAVISKERIKDVFYEMSQKQYWVSCMETAEHATPDEDDEPHVPTDDELARYPRPEFMSKEHTVSYKLSDRLKLVIGQPVLEFLEQVVRLELHDIHRHLIDSFDGAVPKCFKNMNFANFAERILLNKSVDSDEVNDYFGKFEISYVPLFVEGNVASVYTIKALAQIIAIEIMNVRKSGIKYKKCKICGMLFIDGTGRGQARVYCEYPYKEGMCAEKGKKLNEANQSKVKKEYKKIYDKVRKYCAYHKDRGTIEDNVSWEAEFSEYHQKLVEKNLGEDEHINLLKDWFANKKKSVKKK